MDFFILTANPTTVVKQTYQRVMSTELSACGSFCSNVDHVSQRVLGSGRSTKQIMAFDQYWNMRPDNNSLLARIRREKTTLFVIIDDECHYGPGQRSVRDEVGPSTISSHLETGLTSLPSNTHRW